MVEKDELDRVAAVSREAIRSGIHAMRRLSTACTLTPTQLYTLTLLSAAPMGMSELARLNGVSLPSTSQHITKLIDLGYVERRRHPTDARATLLDITDAGRTTTNAENAARNEQVAAFLSELSDAEVTALRDGAAAMNKLWSIIASQQS